MKIGRPDFGFSEVKATKQSQCGWKISERLISNSVNNGGFFPRNRFSWNLLNPRGSSEYFSIIKLLKL